MVMLAECDAVPSVTSHALAWTPGAMSTRPSAK
jgi:hypothetical protein